MRFQLAFGFFINRIGGGSNLLMLTLCQFIPVVGPIVLAGYRARVAVSLIRDPDMLAHPKFDWNHFSKHLMRGLWPFLMAMIVSLAVWALARKIRSLQRGWKSAHIPMIVKPGRYEAVVADFETGLREAGLPVIRKRAGRGLELPVRLLASVGGEKVRTAIPREVAEFEADELDVLVYPSDVALLGRADLVSAARAAIARRLAFADAYVTGTMESQQIEDRLREISRQPKVISDDFKPIDELLTTLDAPYDEWETLYRLRLQVEQERRLPDSTAPAEAA